MFFRLVKLLVGIKFIPVAITEDTKNPFGRTEIRFKCLALRTLISGLIWCVLPIFLNVSYFWVANWSGTPHLGLAQADHWYGDCDITMEHFKCFIHKVKYFSWSIINLLPGLLVAPTLGKALHTTGRDDLEIACETWLCHGYLDLLTALSVVQQAGAFLTIVFVIHRRRPIRNEAKTIMTMTNLGITACKLYIVFATLVLCRLMASLKHRIATSTVDEFSRLVDVYKVRRANFEPLFFVITFYTLVIGVIRGYWTIAVTSDTVEILGSVSHCGQLGVQLFMLCNEANSCFKAIKERISQLRQARRWASQEKLEEIDHVLDCCQDLEPFSAMDFYYVDRGLFASSVGMTITYLVILIQF